jgi:nitrous oxidase accessory protein NosD
MLAGIAAFASWYDSQRASQPSAVKHKTVLAHVTNGADRGPGTLRESLFLVAGAAGPATILIEVPSIKLESALPPFVNSHEVRLVGKFTGAQIDARALSEGPVLDIAGTDISIEGITIQGCPGAAVLVRAVRFRLAGSVIQSCDVGVEIAENASDTLLEHNKFAKDRLGVRFAASHRKSVVANNDFIEDKDAGLWAVRSAPDSRDEPVGIHNNKFTADGNAIVVGNVPVLVEHNDFINSRIAAVHIVGTGAVIRGNHVSGGGSMGIIGENARSAIIEGNELEGLTAYGIMIRGSSNVLIRDNRLHNCGYGIAFVLGDLHNVSTAVNNTIIEPKFNGIDVIGDSPNLRRNQVLHARAQALHVEDFQPPNGQKVTAQPVLDNNNFSDSLQGTTAATLPLAK